MYELIDDDAIDGAEPISDWVGKELRANGIALLSRGASGSYAWSRQLSAGLVTLAVSAASPISTHPDYWYNLPFITRATPYQRELTIRIVGTVAGSVDIALWCEGVASAPTTISTSTGAYEVTVEIPRRALGTPLRCALLIRSQVGASLESGTVTGASATHIITDTTVSTTTRRAVHAFLALSENGAASPGRGWQGQTRYHVIRAALVDGVDDFEIWPETGRSLITPETIVGIDAEVSEIGTLTLLSLQRWVETPDETGILQATETNAGKLVRSEWWRRLSRMAAGCYVASSQDVWLGGVAGVPRTTGTVLGASTIGGRLWGGWVYGSGAVDIVQTVMRRRGDVAGVLIHILYTSDAAAELIVEADGVEIGRTDLVASATGAVERDTPSRQGTMHWRHAPFTRDQCSSQDLGFHGPELAGWAGDIARLQVAQIRIPWADPEPSTGDLVKLGLSIDATDRLYVASVLVSELTAIEQGSAFWPPLEPPPLTALQLIEEPGRTVRDQQDLLYQTRLRCVYAEWSDDGLSRSQDSRTNDVIAISYTTSPDLPAGTVLRLTADTEGSGGNGTLSWTVGATTVTQTMAARAVQTSDIAVASDTTYSITLTIAPNSAGIIALCYLLRIEEYQP